MLNQSTMQAVAVLFALALGLQLLASALVVLAEPLAIVLVAAAVLRVVWFWTTR